MRYQWLRNGAVIPGATNLSYKITTADLDTSITLRARGITSGLPLVTIYSLPVKPSTLKPLVLAADRDAQIFGVPTVGNIMGSYGGDWTQAGATNKYQWLRNGAPIVGQTGKTYKLTAADAGKKVTLAVTGTLKGAADTTVEGGTRMPKITL